MQLEQSAQRFGHQVYLTLIGAGISVGEVLERLDGGLGELGHRGHDPGAEIMHDLRVSRRTICGRGLV